MGTSMIGIPAQVAVDNNSHMRLDVDEKNVDVYYMRAVHYWFLTALSRNLPTEFLLQKHLGVRMRTMVGKHVDLNTGTYMDWDMDLYLDTYMDWDMDMDWNMMALLVGKNS